jgi:hypothetical protein
MQTVYLLKDCIKCYKALIKLYNTPDLSTNIIIVDKYQARILLLDKRIKYFPFIINTLPTNIGLIPKIATVLPLEMFLTLTIKPTNYNRPRNYNRPTNYNRPRNYNRPTNYNRPRNYNRPTNCIKTPIIRKINQPDGGISIILNK